MSEIPLYDDAGINLADPHDGKGHKTAYISHIQIEALRRMLGPITGAAADVGCGYGRMSQRLKSLGFDRLIGIDPSKRVIDAARKLSPEIDFRVGALPCLPLKPGEVDAIFILNVLRSLHLLGITDVASGAASSLSSGGRIIVLDNLRESHPDYLSEQDVVELFTSAGLRLVARESIRGARWPWVPLLRFGLVPRCMYSALASFELAWMKYHPMPSRWQYINVVWVFEKT